MPVDCSAPWTEVLKPAEELAEAAAEPTKMAIGVEGGFNVDEDAAKYDVVKVRGSLSSTPRVGGSIGSSSFNRNRNRSIGLEEALH